MSKIRKRVILLWLLFPLSTIQCYSQTNLYSTNYQLLESRGAIPKDFLRSYDHVKIPEENKLKRRERLDLEKKLTFFNYALQRFLWSGKVLFGDPVTEYLNGVANRVLEEIPEIKTKVRIYTVKSDEPTMYITPDGILFVNTGLLTKLKNESELAFMMVHEFVRYRKGSIEKTIVDPLDYYGEEPYITHVWEMFDILSVREEDTSVREGDTPGVIKRDIKTIRILSDVGYDLDRAIGVYRSLSEVDMPWKNIPFEKSFFEYGKYVFPDHYFDIEEDSSEDAISRSDSSNFYPFLVERSKAAQITLEEIRRKDIEYRDDSVKFSEIQILAAFELSEIYLMDRKYCEAVYNSYVLMREYPDNMYLKSAIARSLLLLSKYKRLNYLEDVLPSHDEMRGEIRILCYFLNQISKEEAAILATSQLLQIEKYFPGSDPWYFTDEAIKLLVHDFHLKPEDFSRDSLERLKDKPDVDSSKVRESGLSSALRRLTKPAKKRIRYKYRMYAFDDDRVDTAKFHSLMKKHYKVHLENNSPYRTLRRARLFSNHPHGYRHDKLRYNMSRYSGLGIDSIAVVDPLCLYADFKRKKKIKVDHEKSVDLKKTYHDLIQKNIAVSDIYGHLITSIEIDRDDTRLFNEIGVLRSWFRERLSHQHMGVPVSSRDRAVSAIDSPGGIDHVYFSDMFVHRMKKKGRYLLAVVFALPVATLPISIYHIVAKYNHSYRFNYLFNIRNGQAFIYEARSFYTPPYKDYLNVQIGNEFFDIQNDKELNIAHPKVVETSTLEELLNNYN